MADLKYYDIIQKPVITEATMQEFAEKKYAFYVHPDATKIQIREAVEKMFDGTKVDWVNTINVKGKMKRRGYTRGKTPDRKKAIVKLKADSKEIEIFQGM
ncbi:MAG: 50S ribosomal protein L23 [Clostridiales bacterium]|jgi:large subunit ribosomal protein L23|nr:50S ribosomal protein L23 [Clostridiales bacterium]